MPESDSAPQDAAVSAVLDALSSPALLLGTDGRIRHANGGWHAKVAALADDRLAEVHRTTDYVGLTRRLARTPEALAFADRLDALLRGDLDEVRYDYTISSPGCCRWYRLTATRLDVADRIIVTHVDVTAEVQASRETDWLSRHDRLTELPNRAYLHDLLDGELRRTNRGPVSLLVLDLDGFAEVNDTLGQEAGDALLREVAGRLRALARGGDSVARLGGDEFVLLCPDTGADGLEALAERCRTELARPFTPCGRTVRLSACIGLVTTGGATGAGSADLVRDAGLALHAAKTGGHDRLRRFTPDLLAAAAQRAGLAAELREAIPAGQLVLHYQPIMYVPTRACTGVETLVRWQHPTRGLLGPGEFLPTAEQHDLMLPLTRWVLRAAAEQTVEWQRRGLSLVTGVNVHAGHFATGTLVTDVLGALADAGLPPSQLVIELTETAVAEDSEAAAAQFRELRRAGVEVSLDDFGSGFSSLSQIVSMPAGIIKIDRGLVGFAPGRRRRSAAAIAAVVAMGAACGMRTLAEGVETAEQFDLAVELGCTFAQGYHLARPMPADELFAWMAARPEHRSAVAAGVGA
ncbi:putative bifunctional diguanylate cyclase/phosphodiesterase [Trujillonella endophytica]|uniref:Diguanylate cyclase (GGDEF) domain-containing protein n=1 Tax=Trujillonella endophytica TaxID=673521 RepID=A0A1H8S926_9ACTN|nr:EAL domain-containing protein [Trujillella endophytica]SEO75161.1 diguanylate cyclase (GGDEF) domain-containing protein [Trujillella endophytica]